MLGRLAKGRSALGAEVLARCQHLFLIGRCCVVWLHHAKVFRAARYGFSRFVREALGELWRMQASIAAWKPERSRIKTALENPAAIILGQDRGPRPPGGLIGA
jgi:hypothetical protein